MDKYQLKQKLLTLREKASTMDNPPDEMVIQILILEAKVAAFDEEKKGVMAYNQDYERYEFWEMMLFVWRVGDCEDIVLLEGWRNFVFFFLDCVMIIIRMFAFFD